MRNMLNWKKKKMDNNIKFVKLVALGTMVESSYLMHLEQLAKLEDEINRACKFGNRITCDYDLADGVIVILNDFDTIRKIKVKLSILAEFLKTHDKISFDEFVELSRE